LQNARKSDVPKVSSAKIRQKAFAWEGKCAQKYANNLAKFIQIDVAIFGAPKVSGAKIRQYAFTRRENAHKSDVKTVNPRFLSCISS